MKRRQFLGGIGLGLLATPVVARSTLFDMKSSSTAKALVWGEEKLELKNIPAVDCYVGEYRYVPANGDWRISGCKVWQVLEAA
jgi:hypothetical protein